MRRIGILGGTFDPVHLGHLRVAEEAREALGLDLVLFVPAGHPPHKRRPDLSPFALRAEMVRRAVAEVPHFELSEIEGERPGPSYTVHTLAALRGEFPGAELFFLLGLDAFLEIETWFRFRDLPRLAHLAILSRGGGRRSDFVRQVRTAFPEAKPEGDSFRVPGGGGLLFLPVTRLEVSATEVRRLVREGRSIRFLVPEPVRELILREGLYSCSAGGSR